MSVPSVRDHHLSESLSLSESDLEDKEEIDGDDRISLSWKGIRVETKPKGYSLSPIPFVFKTLRPSVRPSVRHQ